MSFFYDFLKYFDIQDLTNKITITTIVEHGVVITGNLRLSEISDNLIVLRSKKESVKIFGESLKIKSIAKGEVVIAGIVSKCEMGEKS